MNNDNTQNNNLQNSNGQPLENNSNVDILSNQQPINIGNFTNIDSGIVDNGTTNILEQGQPLTQQVNTDANNLNQPQIEVLQTEMNNIQPQMNTVQPDMSTIQPQMNTVQSDMSTIQPQMDTVQSDMGTIQPQMDTVQPDMGTIQPQMNAVQPDQNNGQQNLGIPPIQDYTNQQPNIGYEQQPISGFNNIETPKKKKSNKAAIILIFVALLLAAFFGVYKFILSSPKVIVNSVINKLYKSTDKALDTLDDKIDFTKPWMIDNSFFVDSNISGLETLKNYKFDITTGMDTTNQKIYSGMKIDNGSSNIVDVKGLIKNDASYIDLGSLYTKIIKVTSANQETFDTLKKAIENVNIEEYKTIIKEEKDIIIAEINKQKYSESSETVTINNKEVKLNTIVLSFDGQSYLTFRTNIIDAMINDDTLITALAKATNKEKSEIIDSLNNDKKGYSASDYKNVTYTLYTSGFTKQIVGGSLIIDDATMIKGAIVNGDGFINGKDTNNKQFNVTISDKKYITITDDDQNIDLTINSLKENNVNIDYKSVSGENTYSGNVTITEGNNGIYNIVLTYSDGTNKVNVNLTTTITNNATLPTLNESNAIEYTALTSNDITTITNNLQAKIKGTIFEDIYTMASSFLGSSSTYTTSSSIYNYDNYYSNYSTSTSDLGF